MPRLPVAEWCISRQALTSPIRSGSSQKLRCTWIGGLCCLRGACTPRGHEEILAMLTAEGILPGGGVGDNGSFYAGDHFGLDAPPPASNGENSSTAPPSHSFASAFTS